MREDNRTDRRALLVLAASLGAGGMGIGLLAPRRAGAVTLNPGDPIQAGEENDLPDTVTLLRTDSSNANVAIVNLIDEPALVATGESLGLVAYDSYSTSAQPSLGAGEKAGILARGRDYGVMSSSTGGEGLHGETVAGTGVLARATGRGRALRVEGTASFTSAGRSRFARGQNTKRITGVRVPPGAKILVTMNGDPGAGNTIKLARRLSGRAFEVQLLANATKAAAFSYFVIA